MSALLQLPAAPRSTPRPARRGPPRDGLGLYVHIPFCVRKCPYCDFHAGPAPTATRRRYVEALEAEIRRSPWRGAGARTVFFGGGTPSELDTPELARIATALRQAFPGTAAPETEWSIECNPGTVTPASLAAMREMGFNRISLGVQSFDDRHLRALRRIHSAAEAVRAVDDARRAGFRRLNLDLIFCLPGQSLAEWQFDVERALELAPEHLSLYNLTIEERTQFGRLHGLGRMALPDEEVSADMYEWAIRRTGSAGYEHYEVSNFARPGEECRHNRIYWRQEPYIGFGLAAASYEDGVRWTNTTSMQRYLQTAATGLPERAAEERLAPREACGEAIMLGLRTREGVDLGAVGARYGLDAEREWRAALRRLHEDGLLARSGPVARLTHRGLMLANAVCAEFL